MNDLVAIEQRVIEECRQAGFEVAFKLRGCRLDESFSGDVVRMVEGAVNESEFIIYFVEKSDEELADRCVQFVADYMLKGRGR